MDDALWKLAGFLLAAVLLFLVPTMALLERQDDVTRALVQAEANRFVDTARDMGAISPRLYARFADRLAMTGLRYDIRIRHEKRAWTPEYVEGAGGLSFTGEYGQSRVTEGEQNVLATLFPQGSAAIDDPSRQYGMHAGDLLFVEVESRGDTMAGALRKMIFSRKSAGMGILARAGGMVRNEAD